MTVKQLHSKLGKEIRDGNGHHLMYVWAYGATQDDVEISSVKIKSFVHCSDAVVLKPEKKMTLLKTYLQVIKQSFDDYYANLKKSLSL